MKESMIRRCLLLLAALTALVASSPSAFADYSVTGQFQYQDRIFTSNGFTGALSFRPIRYANVQIVAVLTSTVLAAGATDEYGNFSIQVPGSAQQAIKAVCYASSTTNGSGRQLEVRTYSGSLPSPTFGGIYLLSSPSVNYSGTDSLYMGQTQASYSTDSGKAFNIWDIANDGMDFLSGTISSLPTTKLTILWRSSGDARSFYYSDLDNASAPFRYALIGSVSGYDDTIIAHQFGHFVADIYSKLDRSSNLPNYGLPSSMSYLFSSNDDVRVAWAEGFGMFFGASIRKFKGYDNPDMYVITNGANLLMSVSIETLSGSAPLGQLKGSTNILAVSSALWSITGSGLGRPFSDIWEVLTAYIPTVTRSAISTEDFWDGWFSPAVDNGSLPEMQTIFATQNGIEFLLDAQEPNDSPNTAAIVLPAQLSLSSGSRVVISEVSLETPGAIELFNAGDIDADLTGWTISATRSGANSVPVELPSFTLKSGAFVIISGAAGVNGKNILYINSAMPWLSGSDGSCALKDNGAEARDFVRWGSSIETPPGSLTFSGANPDSPAAGMSLGRNHAGANTYSGADWTIQKPSPGDFNASGLEQHHTFYSAADVDYAALEATAGRTYIIETVNLLSGADTCLDLLAKDGMTVLATSDDYGRAKSSKIVWTSAATDQYYIRIRRFDGPTNIARYGSFDLRIIESAQPLPADSSDTLTVSKAGHGGRYQTIGAAIEDAGNGDTIKILDSETYRENLSISGKSIILKAAAGQNPILDGRGSPSFNALIVTGTKSFRLENLTILGGYNGINLRSGSSVLSNLVVNRATYSGIYITGAYTTAKIINNTIVSNGVLGVAVLNKGSGIISNSIFSGQSGSSQADLGGDGSWTAFEVKYSIGTANKGVTGGSNGNLNGDPVFVNASSSNFRLQSNSPCIDKGNGSDADLPSTDADGVSRILDGNGDLNPVPDMGAYEYWSPNLLSSSAIFPQIAVGMASDGEYRTALYAINFGAQQVISRLSLTDNGGSPLSANLGSFSASTVDRVIPSLGTLHLESSLPGNPIAAGYARFASSLPLGGSALFKVYDGSRITSEAGVGIAILTKNFTVYIDYMENAQSGYAIANPGSIEARLTYTLRDKNGVQVGVPLSAILLPFQHIAQFAHELFPATAFVGFEGSLEVTSDQDVAAVALRYDNAVQGVFSTIPVLVNEANTTLYFPQAADGLGYQTDFILINPGYQESTAKLEFFDDAGKPLAFPISGTFRTAYEITINGKGVAHFLTDGTSQELTIGWVKVTSSAALGGSSIFQTRLGGRITAEAGVSSSPSAYRFMTYVESTGYTESGIALANPNSNEVTMILNLRDTDGNLVAAKEIKIPALGHIARFFTKWFPGGFEEFEGSLEIQANGPFSAVSLRYDNPEADVFTTLPLVVAQ